MGVIYQIERHAIARKYKLMKTLCPKTNKVSNPCAFQKNFID